MKKLRLFVAVILIGNISAFAQDGTLDNSFSSDGKYTLTRNLATLFSSGDLFPDGSMIIGGQTINNGEKGILVNLTNNGVLNTNFNSSGIIESDNGRILKVKILGSRIFALSTTHIQEFSATGSAVRSKQLPAGVTPLAMDVSATAVYISGYNTSNQTVILKYDLTLNPVSSFGSSGVLTKNFATGAVWEKGQDILFRNGMIYGLAIYAAGSATRLDDIGYVYKLDTSGSPDVNFGNSGASLVLDTMRDHKQPWSIAWDPVDNAIFIGGSSYIIKIRGSNGSMDNTYGSNGIFIPASTDFRPVIACQTDGKPILFATSDASSRDFLLWRTDPSGSLDNTFGTNGKVQTSIVNNDFNDAILYDTANDKIVAIGHGDNTSVIGIVCRYNSSSTVGIAPASVGEYVLSPNPCHSYFRVSTPGTGPVKTVAVYDQVGKLVYKIHDPEDRILIDRSAIRPGVYLVRVATGSEIYSGRLLVE